MASEQSAGQSKRPCLLGKDRLLVQIPGSPDLGWIKRLEAKYPGLRVQWEELFWKPGDSTETGSTDLPAEVWNGVTIACLFLPHTASLMSSVRLVQLTSAGVDKWAKHETYKDPNVTICTASGVHPPQLAEWVISTWLMMRNGYLNYAAAQKQGKWSKALMNVQDTPGMRMGILGYGSIGRQCARLADAMGMQVYAYTQRPRLTTESRRYTGYSLPGVGDPDGSIPTAWYHGTTREALHAFLHLDLDILVLTLPLTDSTRHLLGKEEFEILSRKRTFISNVSRGQLIATDDLVEALRLDKIQGAALDVTDPEPLPDNHPLFTSPNVFISPHVGYRTQSYFKRVLEILEANLDRLDEGRQLLNVVEK